MKKIVNFFLNRKEYPIMYSDSPVMHYIRHKQYFKIDLNSIDNNEFFKRNKFGESILSLCIDNHLNDLAKKIIVKLKIENEINKINLTPLMNAINSENLEMFYFLLNNGADYNYINEEGDSVLSFAARKKEFLREVVKKTNIQTHTNNPNFKNPLLVSCSHKINEDDLHQKLIEFGYLDSLKTKDVIDLIKNLMEIFQIRAVQKICSYNISKDSFVDLNHIFYKEKEGFVDGKLLIKLENFKEFKFLDHDLENFHKKLNIINKDISFLLYKNILKPYNEDLFSNLWEVNCSLINCIEFVKRNFNIDENFLRPLFSHKNTFPINFNEDVFKKLLMNYSHKRKISLLLSDFNGYYLRDTLFMYDQIERFCFEFSMDVKLFLPKKPKSILEIHDKLQKVISKIGKNNIPIDSYLKEEHRKINGQMFNEYVLKTPKNNAELIEISERLSMCIGNGYYGNQMAKGEILLVLLKKDKKIDYCIEYCLKTDKILQAVTYYNIEMDKNAQNRLESLIYSIVKSEDRQRGQNENTN